MGSDTALAQIVALVQTAMQKIGFPVEAAPLFKVLCALKAHGFVNTTPKIILKHEAETVDRAVFLAPGRDPLRVPDERMMPLDAAAVGALSTAEAELVEPGLPALEPGVVENQRLGRFALWGFRSQGGDGQPHLKGRRRATGEQSPGRGKHGSTLNDWVRQYHQGVLALDEAVGRLIAALKSTGQYDNTLIVFTSDQGFAWGQHGFRSKVAPYDATIRSPMILSMPKRFAGGKVCGSPVGGVDLAPTFFEMAGIDLPWKMHGRSLVPLLKSPETKWDRPLLVSFTGRKYGADTMRHRGCFNCIVSAWVDD